MLSKVLQKSTCAKCRFCCGFDKSDSWEIPVISRKLADDLEKKGIKTVETEGCLKYDLEFIGDEVKYCPFHSNLTGCTLDNNDKPFDCKIWPLRVMKSGDDYVIACADSCPAFKADKSALISLAKELLPQIKAYIKENPYIINELKDDYNTLFKINLER